MAHGESKWLNREFFSTCLKEEIKCGENIEVLKYTSLPVVPEGNNFGSCLRRVNLDFKKVGEEPVQSLTLIVKSPVNDDFMADLVNTYKDVEPKFYYQFLPIAKQLGCDSFAPKSYFSPDPLIIIMEDLKEQGYKMLDRREQLDYDHCRLYATVSAMFHAVSIAVHKTNPELVVSLGDEKMFSEKSKVTESLKVIMRQSLDCMSEFMEKTEYKNYAKMVKDAKSYLCEKVVEAHKPHGKLNSLNQGDPWVTNMMFKYDNSGKVSGVKLLDFQVLRYGSPLNDLVYCIWTSGSHDVRENRLEDVFHVYCDTLNSKLQELDCSETLSYDDLLNAVKALNPAMLFLLATFVPLQVSPEPADFSDLVSIERDSNGQEINKMAKFYTQNYCDHFLTRYLRQSEHAGVFEYLKQNS